MLEGEVRGLTQNGTFQMRGAITDAYNRDDSGNVIPGDWIRGYIQAQGKLQLDKYWDVGVDAEHASDITFLEFYHFSGQAMLTSRLYAERIEDRDYVSVESLAFQGLTPEDQPSVSPYILPQVNAHYESDPLAANSRIQLDANALVLERSQGDDDQRLSTTAAWKLPYITRGGQVFELNASLRGDAYHVTDQVTDPATDATFNGDTGRFIPQVDLDWRYPFINRFGEGESLMVAPVVEAVASPNLHETSNIPNEDSQVAELSDVNLFSPDRFTGLDQVESGLRGTYGTRGQLQFADQKYIEWLFGQAYQENENSPFPLTSAEVAHYSDYIGRLAFKYEALDLVYNFRLDRQTFAPTSNEVNLSYAQKPVNLDLTYLSLQNEPLFGDRKEVFGNVAFDVAPHWTLQLGGRRDLGSSEGQPVNTSLPVSSLNPLEPTAGTVGINSGIVFHNECVMVTTMLNRSYISEQDVKPSTTFGVTLVLKNFGAPVASAGSASSSITNPDAVNTVATGNIAPINPAGNIVNNTAGPADGNAPATNTGTSGSWN
jgi:LPS-assembly protein